MLLTRDKFRQGVFERDNHKCVFCDKPAKDAHHIMERRLFSDGGYYILNGASVCEEHHILCETTEITTQEVREACGIEKIILPEDFYEDQVYDKWGNICLPNGNRLKGELFFDESVQKILKKGNKLDLFISQVKYPRTRHCTWSDGMNSDDKIHKDMTHFQGKRVIVSLKMDGENSTVYSDYFHARSIDGRNHESRNWVKNFVSGFQYDIPDNWRICGENLYAEHSIKYDNLKSYFYGFSVWNDKNECLSWDQTQEWFQLLGIISVPVLYDGIYDEEKIKSLYSEDKWETMEGYVIRLAESFSYFDFKNSVAKFVRKNHVQTAKHNWQSQKIIPNKLEEN
ncbi:MAG: RNA ligase [Caudoviricetes sp.]|nr:MAG: RNA ligase [Caudoviricetes sp.]